MKAVVGAVTTERRGGQRIRRRMPLVLLDGRGEHHGYTVNLSPSGLCVAIDRVFTPGVSILGRLLVPGSAIPFRAEVRWVRKVRPGQALEEKNTMGLRFLEALDPAALEQLSLAGSPPPAPAATRARRALPPLPPPLPPPPAASRRQEAPAIGANAAVGTLVTARDIDRAGPLLCRLVEWAEHAACEAVGPDAVTTSGVSLDMTRSHVESMPLGTLLVTTARLVSMSPDGRRLTFDIRVKDGDRDIAFARHVRARTEGAALGRLAMPVAAHDQLGLTGPSGRGRRSSRKHSAGVTSAPAR